MTYRAHIEHGNIVLDTPVKLPEGTVLSIRPLRTPAKKKAAPKREPTLAERLAPLIGKTRGLPSDMALNHDHYLYGAPKRKARG